MIEVESRSGPLDAEARRLIDAYWRAANYLSVIVGGPQASSVSY
jgi:hypothetical protein